MGYMTRYSLYTRPGIDNLEKEPELQDLGFYGSAGFYDADERMKWYMHQDDMLTVSSRYPDVLFILDGDGEESGDIWRKFFQNGKMLREWKVNTERPENP